MVFDPLHIDLPVNDIIPAVKNKFIKNNTLIITAPPGAGKSTLLPLALLNEPWLENKKIYMLEPRRLAARSIAMRMAELLGEEVGKTVGYRIRFENRISPATRIEVLTEGILTRMLQSDNSLEDASMVIFDEFHERSIHADVALALTRDAQKILRPALRIMIMSATLDMPTLSGLLEAPVVESKGRQYPVEVIYTGEQDLMMLPEMTARTVIKAAKDNEGDILVFLPGEGEIKKCAELLKPGLTNFAIHPLYSKLPPHKQYAAIMPSKFGKRKVVLATSIAETSLTIEGIKVVVDTGYGRTSRFDPNTGLSRLETVQISKDSADQRAGRAGRLSPGTCYRMWSKATQERLNEHRIPEILEADLAPLLLELAQWNIADPYSLTWLTPPPKGALAQASAVLHDLEALEDGRITDHGKQVNKLPCHPRIAHMLLMAHGEQSLSLATDLAAILEERDPLEREAGIDINLRIEALRRFRERNGTNKKFNRIEKVASSYRNIFNIDIDNGPVDSFTTGFLIAQAYPERIASARPGNNAQFQMANGSLAMAGHKDDLAHESWLAIAHVNARENMGKIFLASPLDPKDLAPLVRQKEVITWDTKKGGVVATKDLRIGSIILQSLPLLSPDKNLIIKAISEAVKKEGERLLDFNEEVVQWQNRVLSLCKWNPDEEWPDVSTDNLLSTNERWLSPYLQQVKKPEDIKKINLKEVLHHQLDYEKQELLNKLAPEHIEVPTGSKIRLRYFSDGAPPVLAVRLQEVFGMQDTPKVNRGKISVIMHLLSPGFKPVQITSDLRSFWNNTYFDVKKDLKGRYPKHEWPEDPLSAVPVRGVKRKKV
ncbi:MAG: ATP-dependent helicase HrpB [Candidatus Cyclobacteriaceae bacterium M2_1C_046]